MVTGSTTSKTDLAGKPGSSAKSSLVVSTKRARRWAAVVTNGLTALIMKANSWTASFPASAFTTSQNRRRPTKGSSKTMSLRARASSLTRTDASTPEISATG